MLDGRRGTLCCVREGIGNGKGTDFHLMIVSGIYETCSKASFSVVIGEE